ncbi:hypothetical protein ACQY1Q_12010 [Tenacibaculum sp. TC6]|uniref:hypothetical protein n=1 Tax=Tenacibaculum sp. TC6 TaxID=3423223 RepID=UPI003D36EBC2
MNKHILNLGKALDKATLKKINAGEDPSGFCDSSGNCPEGYYCDGDFCYKNPLSGGGGGCPGPWIICINGELGCIVCI